VGGDDEVQPSEDGGETGDEGAHGHEHDIGVAVRAAVGGVEGPASISAAGHDGSGSEQPPGHEDVPTGEVEFGECQIAGANHHWQQEITEHRGDRGDEEEEDHDDAVQREQAVVGLGDDEVAGRCHQLQAEEHRSRSTQEEEQRHGDHVQDGDPLMVGRPKPRAEAVIHIQVVAAGIRVHGK